VISLNDRRLYWLSILLTVVEFAVECQMYPEWKASKLQLNFLGLVFMAVGQYVKSYAMINLVSNLETQKKDSEVEKPQLITSGMFQVLRHPIFFGVYWWNVGSQMVLFNPVSFLVHSFVGWFYFSRYLIPREEKELHQLYPDQYPIYRKRTGVGIPYTM